MGMDPARVDAVVGEIKSAGGEAVSIIGDISEMDVAEQLIRTAIDEYGGLDILVCAHGILRERMIFNMTEDDWDAVTTKASVSASTVPATNDRGLGSIRYAKSASQLPVAHHARGQLQRLASASSTADSREKMPTMLATDAPRTLRMPISLVRRATVSVAWPNTPTPVSSNALRLVSLPASGNCPSATPPGLSSLICCLSVAA